MNSVSKVDSSVYDSYKSRLSSEPRNSWCLWRVFSVIAALIGVFNPSLDAQQTHLQSLEGVTIQGTVFNLAGRSVGDASVKLEQKGALRPVEMKTDAAGDFAFTNLQPGHYLLSAEKSGQRSHGTAILELSPGDRKNIDLILDTPRDVEPNPSTSSALHSRAIEFSDKPTFAVAGVVDWTAVGGHGSDSTLRTSEDLARKTLTLKPDGSSQSEAVLPGAVSNANESESKLRAALDNSTGSFEGNHQLGDFYLRAGRYKESIPFLEAAYRIDPAMDSNSYDLARAYKEAGDFSQGREQVQKLLRHKDSAELHRLAGEIDEKLGDPLAAVQEEERAVRLDPSEQNYFEWGSELLLHRAVWQAVEVFRNGVEVYPKSSRMLTALGTSLFAGALYGEAAIRLCDASDLNPADPEPYIFMGKVEREAPTPLPCVEQRLARFVLNQPESPLASYLYAMAVWKRQTQPVDQKVLQQVVALLTKVVTIDPNCADAYLQLGIIYYSQHSYEKAIGFYTKALEVDPQLGEAHYRLGVAYDRTGEPAKAHKEFVLHDEIERRQAAAVERQRREIKQFLIVLKGQPNPPTAQ
jgi:tetratricopeptide (TPR) repeat protein